MWDNISYTNNTKPLYSTHKHKKLTTNGDLKPDLGQYKNMAKNTKSYMFFLYINGGSGWLNELGSWIT